MNNFKRLSAFALASAMTLSLAACGGSASEATGEAGEVAKKNYFALVTDVANIDDQSFNQGSYEGMVAYAKAQGIEYDYYRPSEDSTAARVESIETAISNGATALVLPGYLFAEALPLVQDKYPEVMFLGVDVSAGDVLANGATQINDNVALVTYQDEQAGYLAGYAAVMDGYTSLGFLGGMAVPAVVRYGYGYVQGADAAATEMGVEATMNYWYGNTFGPSDDVKVKMDAWYSSGTEAVFACGGGIYLSALAAADIAGGEVIGVDVDQANVSDLIVTSAMKDLGASIQLALDAMMNNDGVWPEQFGGQESVLGVAEGAIALPTASTSWRFDNYTVESYEEILAKLASGEVVVSANVEEAPETTTLTVNYQG